MSWSVSAWTQTDTRVTFQPNTFWSQMKAMLAKIEIIYLNSTLNFGIPPILVFQLEVYSKVDRLLSGLTAQLKGTTAWWYSNKASLRRFAMASILPWLKDVVHFVFRLYIKKAEIAPLWSLSVCLFWIELDLEDCPILFHSNVHILEQ